MQAMGLTLIIYRFRDRGRDGGGGGGVEYVVCGGEGRSKD